MRGDSLDLTVIKGKLEGKRGRGRSATQMGNGGGGGGGGDCMEA